MRFTSELVARTSHDRFEDTISVERFRSHQLYPDVFRRVLHGVEHISYSSRAVDCVVVYRYDRFARSLRQLVNALEEFRSLGIDFISLHEGVDTSTPNGRLVFGIFASIAEFERELIRDRVRSGIALAKSRGKLLGRPRVVVDCMRIASLRKEGRSWAEICNALDISKGTAQRAVLSLPKNLLEIASLSS